MDGNNFQQKSGDSGIATARALGAKEINGGHKVMIILLAIRLLFIMLYHGSIAFGVFAAAAITDALFDRLEEWSMNRARQVVVVQ